MRLRCTDLISVYHPQSNSDQLDDNNNDQHKEELQEKYKN